MRIFILSQSTPYPVYKDGMTIRVYHLIKELSKFAECYLLALTEESDQTGKQNWFDGMVECEGVEYKQPRGLIGNAVKWMSKKRFYSIKVERIIENRIREFSPDVVLAEQTFMSTYINAFKNKKKVMAAVDAISLAAKRLSDSNCGLFERVVWRHIAEQRLLIEKEYFPRFDRTIVVGDEDATYLRNLLDCRVDVISNGVDTEFFHPRFVSKNPNSLVFTGNLHAPMNEEAAIYLLREVFPTIRKKYTKVKMIIAGRQPSRKLFANKPGYVDIIPNVEDIRNVLSKAMVYVSPIQYGTGIKNTVLQAMSMGIPVVTTPQIAGSLHVRANWNCVIEERGKAYIKAVEALLENGEKAKEIGLLGRQHIEREFGWEHIALSYLHLFNEIQ